MSSGIPKAKKIQAVDTKVPRPQFIHSETGISFSFETLETNEYFNLEGTCNNWSSELFQMMRTVSAVKKEELLSGHYRIYRVHNHENAHPPVQLPEGVELKDCYQIRISKSKGGIHGVFNGNIFYVIWLDPLHNMYPNDHFGGLRKIKPASTCCKDRDELLQQLNDENQRLREENEYYSEEISKL